MPYILTKSNGTVLTTVQDASIDKTSSLTFVGRNFSGYGQPIEENLLYMLENFANSTAPVNPVAGQLWFNTTTQQLNVSPNGVNFKGVASLTLAATTSSYTGVGDMFWDGSTLKVWDGHSAVLIGPVNGSDVTSWRYGFEKSSDQAQYPAIVGKSGSNAIVAFANNNFIPDATTDLVTSAANGKSVAFNIIRKGITLPGADAVSGSTISSGYYFWGTAAESLASFGSVLSKSTATGNCYIPFASTSTGSTALLTTTSFYINPVSGVLHATATAAQYADLAERYEADEVYEVGTVVVIGGAKEVTAVATMGVTAWAGVVSKEPAYMMNSEAGNDETHPYIALKGRVPCKVIGPISRGDLLVTGRIKGHAEVYDPINQDPNAVFARALEDFNGDLGIIEVKL